MNTEVLASLARWFITSAAGYLISQGWLTEAGGSVLIGGSMAAATAVWSIVSHKGPKKADLIETVKATPGIDSKTLRELGIK